jgi:glyoxylase-like metal-dependent hydrolase (beta-lactamase superfamily II)
MRCIHGDPSWILFSLDRTGRTLQNATASSPIDQPLTPGEILSIAGGFDVIHTPGHCAGQVALLWRPGRMLFAGDVCMNIMGLGDPVGFESLEEGRASQRKLAGLSFDAAGFGHGEPIARDASSRFRNKWCNKSPA